MTTANIADPECEFVGDVPEKLICIICTKPLTEPHLTECCGQHYCKSCLENWLLRNPTCPHCRKENPKHILNKDRVREIKELEVYCTNHQGGCQWRGKLEDLATHRSGCGYTKVKCSQGCGHEMKRKEMVVHKQNECPCTEVKCTGCGQKVRRREMNNHLQNECLFRPYVCEHCKQHRDTYHAITKSEGHYETCPNYPVKCPLKCGKTVQRKDVQIHISGGECRIGSIMEEVMDCTNKCGQQVKGKDLNEHLRNECLLRTYKCEHCGYEKTYLGVTNHYNTCYNYPLPCPKGCGATIMRKNAAAHQNECPHVEVVCLNGCDVTIMRKDITAHQNECSHARISCPNGCGTTIMRKNITSHQTDCPHKCGATIMRKDASAHQNERPNAKLMDCPDCGAIGVPRGNHECFELRPPENNDPPEEQHGGDLDDRPLIQPEQRRNPCYNCNDCYDNRRCACNGRASLSVYCCIWWWLFAAVGMAVILGAVSTFLVTLNQVSTEAAVIEECEIFLLVYGVISVLSGLTFFVGLCLCNCKCTFRNRPQLTLVTLILICSLVVFIAGLICVNYKMAPVAFGNANEVGGDGKTMLRSGYGVMLGVGLNSGNFSGGSGLESGDSSGAGSGGGKLPMELCISEFRGIRLLIIVSDSIFIILCILCILNVIFYCCFEKESPVVYYNIDRYDFMQFE